MTEKEKMLAGDLFNPSDKCFLGMMVKGEISQRMFNKCPIWHQWLRDTLLKKLVGSLGGRPYNVVSPLKVVYGKNIHIGKNFFSNANVFIQDYAEVHIGDNIFIGPNVSIVTIEHPVDYRQRIVQAVPDSLVHRSRGNYERAKPVHIGNNVVIYSGAVICPGVTIGDNSIIGAGSVVTRDIPANVLAFGAPCRVVRAITESDRVEIPF